MKTIVNSIPGYQAYEYLLVIEPHKELSEKIIKVKNKIGSMFGVFMMLESLFLFERIE